MANAENTVIAIRSVACTRCGEEKPQTYEFFRLHKETRKNGESYRTIKRICRACENLAARKWSKENPEKVRKIKKRNYTPEKGRKNRLMHKWKMTLHDYNLIMQTQNYGCGICGRKENLIHSSGVKQDFAVDHDHDTGKIRGLLCDLCNKGIGMFKDRSDFLLFAHDYLKRHGK